ncbi:MAG: RNA-guided endonuclease TnpB family protein [Mariprofundaceae bacterium]|nr:RNA-guided endonuclease TnpB family protein [Mariprofundaceae bacterium]
MSSSVHRDAYQKNGVKLSGLECKRLIPPMRQQAEYSWLKEVNAQNLQEAALNLEKAYERFFSQSLKAGYPSFKRKGNHESFCVPQHFTVDVQNNHICIPKLKTGIKIVFHRSLKHVEKMCSTIISMTPSGKFDASIHVEESIEHRNPVPKVGHAIKTVGIDLGIKDFLVKSNGSKINAPKFLRKSERTLAKAQRRLSRKQKGSLNCKKQGLRVALLHEKIANQRKNFLHKESKRIADENQVIHLESLNVKGMMKNRHLSKAISDCSWSEFVRQLKYKAHWSGAIIVQIGQRKPSSKLCSTKGCDYQHDALKLSDREWTCPPCNETHDRDINAAKNIQQIGLEAPELTPVKKTTSVFSIKKIQADSVKQESHASV